MGTAMKKRRSKWKCTSCAKLVPEHEAYYDDDANILCLECACRNDTLRDLGYLLLSCIGDILVSYGSYGEEFAEFDDY